MDDNLRHLAKEIDPAVLGERIKAARLAARLTQGQMVEGVATAPFVSRVEAGQRRPDYELLKAIAGRVGVSLEALLTGIEPSRRAGARLELDYAELAFATGDLPTALRKAEAVIPRAIDAGADEVRRSAELLRGRTLEAMGKLDEAISVLQPLAESPGQAGWLEATITLASCHRHLGDPHRAIRVGENALEALASLNLSGSAEAVKVTLTLAAAHHEVGATERAVALCEFAAREAEALGDDETRAGAYWNASIVEFEAGRIESAVEFAERSLALLTRLDDTLRKARLRNKLATYQLRLDPPQIDAARENLRLVAEEYRHTPARPIERLRNVMAMAQADFMAGDLDKAAEGARRVLEETHDGVGPRLAADSWIVLGRIAVARRDAASATESFRQAVMQLTRAAADRFVGATWFELAGYLEELGDHDGARDAYRNAGVSAGYASHAPRPAQQTEAHGR